MAQMDITHLQLEDKSQSLVWVSHVLEHVVDDQKAISEIYRVLDWGGVAFIQVPMWKTQTFEDLSLSTPEERLKYFYQPDHGRLYGLDIVDRFENERFSTRVFKAQDFGPDLVVKHRLSFVFTNEVFVLEKAF